MVAVAAAYAGRALRVHLIGTWAMRQTLSSLGLLFPLATRALPMLLLFVTFLFINTEVWMVASELDGGILWGAVMLFAAVAVVVTSSVAQVSSRPRIFVFIAISWRQCSKRSSRFHRHHECGSVTCQNAADFIP